MGGLKVFKTYQKSPQKSKRIPEISKNLPQKSPKNSLKDPKNKRNPKNLSILHTFFEVIYPLIPSSSYCL